ncbi:MAG: peroxiredoxin [Candidatus Zixiibacteriota bacterium]
MQIGKQAPDFRGMAVLPDKEFGEIGLSDYKGKWVVLFFYPLDFTFVCPTEIRGFNEACAKFKSAGAEVIGCSIDSHFSHLNWIERDFKKLDFPLLSDITKEIAQSYGVLLDEGFALRGTFIIDPAGVLKSVVMNDTEIGRSIDETLRTLAALQTGKSTGCGWKPGDPTVKVPALT